MKLMMRMMNLVLPTCEEVSELTSRAMDETLSWQKRLGLRLHLIMCIWCRRNAGQFKLIRNLSHHHQDHHTETEKLNSQAKNRIAKSLRENDDSSSV